MEAVLLHGIWATAVVIVTYFVSKTYQHKQDCIVQKTNSEFLLAAHASESSAGDPDGSLAKTTNDSTRLGT